MKFLYYLSKTDSDVLKYCTQLTRHNQRALGAFVLFTGMLAFFSGTNALSYLFVEEGAFGEEATISGTGRFLTVILGGVYALMIMAIDREIVSASSKWAAILRAPLALVIGVVIAVPMELKLLNGAIEERIKKDDVVQNKNLNNDVDSRINVEQVRVNDLLKTKNKIEDEIAKQSNLMVQEMGGTPNSLTRRSGEGPVYREAKRAKKLQEIRLKGVEDQLERLRSRRDSVAASASYNATKSFVPKSQDLLTRYVILQKLKHDEVDPVKAKATRAMSTGITLLFILLELIPSLIKLFLPKSEYDSLIEARRRLNIQHTHVAVNQRMEEIDDASDYSTFDTDQLKLIKEGLMK